MKQEIKTPILIVVAVVAVIGLAVWGFSFVNNTGNLDQGQIKYTPGVPPWMENDPSKQGPGSAPGGGAQPSASPQGSPGPGVAPPAVSNSGK